MSAAPPGLAGTDHRRPPATHIPDREALAQCAGCGSLFSVNVYGGSPSFREGDEVRLLSELAYAAWSKVERQGRTCKADRLLRQYRRALRDDSYVHTACAHHGRIELLDVLDAA